MFIENGKWGLFPYLFLVIKTGISPEISGRKL